MPFFRRRTNKRGDVVWEVAVFLGLDSNGKSIRVSGTSQSPRKKDAEALARELLARRDKGELVPGGRKCTIGDLLDDVLLDYRINGKKSLWLAQIIVERHVRPVFGAVRVTDLTTSDVQRFIAKRQAEGAKNGTINHDLSLLRRGFNLGQQCTPPKVSPGRVPRFQMLAEDPPRKGFLEDREYQALFGALSEEIRPILAFGYYTGCRKSEVLNLRWEQVDLNECVVRLEVGETKNREGRLIPLIPDLLELLTLQKARRDQCWPTCPWVFFWHDGLHRGEQVRDFRGAWEAASKAAGLWEGDENTGKPVKLYHDLRRSGVRNLIRAGVPERVAMMISGHKSRSILDRYNIVSETDLKDAGHKLTDYLTAKRQSDAEKEITVRLRKNSMTNMGTEVVQ